jgi:oxygen-dependent protoporphyrinogen oxidase
VKRRLGQSFLDYAIDPFILGVYSGDPNRLVTRFALPKLYNLEQKYGSFIGGTIKKGSEPKTEEEKRVTRGVFSTKGGLSSLINALKARIGEENIVTEIANLTVIPAGEHFLVSYTNSEGVMIELEAKKVISTIGAHQLDKVLPFVDPIQLSKITNLFYARVIEVILGFNQWKGIKLDAFGGLVPFRENRDILGALFMSSLFEERAPKDGALFSIFMGGVRRPELCDLSDDQVEAILKKEISAVMKLEEYKPDLLKIIHHQWAIPQYEADTEQRLKAVDDLEQKYPGLIIGGNLRNGIGMADRIYQASILAAAVL